MDNHQNHDDVASFDLTHPDFQEDRGVAETFILLGAGEREAFEQILKMLYDQETVDFTHYRQSTVFRRIARRMALCKKSSFAGYLNHLIADTEELNLLHRDLLLYFTEFFRDPQIFETLKTEIFPLLVENRTVKTPIRVWVPGCSTGEEVYSLAICLYEFLEANKLEVTGQFFGTDLVGDHIVAARSALYSEKIEKHVSPERLERFFDKTPKGYRVIKHIREMCVFATQDITQDPPFPNIDLLSCRNLLIYFDTTFQDTVIPLFHFALKPSGFLLLGTSETLGRFPQLFNQVDKRQNIFSKRILANKQPYRFPVSSSIFNQRIRSQAEPVLRTKHSEAGDLNRKIEQVLLERYAPPGVLVDVNLQIRQFQGRTSRYLDPSTGEASLKLSRMAGHSLMPDLYVAIEEAKRDRKTVRKRNIPFSYGEEQNTIDISVIPVQNEGDSEVFFLLLFEEEKESVRMAVDQAGLDALEDSAKDRELLELRRELMATKEYLQTIIEEKDDVNQELWTANEEVQSTNEELQSVNEELEAAKEELESTNEELIALNEELHLKNTELLESEARFKMVMHQSPAAIEIYDLDGLLIGVNRAFEELWRAPAAHMVNTFNILKNSEADRARLLPYAQRAYGGETVLVPEYRLAPAGGIDGIGGSEGQWLSTRIYPLKDSGGRVKNIVIAVEDVTARKRMEGDLLKIHKLESVGTLAGGIAHDFNNILMGLFGNLTIAKNELPKDHPAMEHLNDAQKSMSRATRLTQQLLIFAKGGNPVREGVSIATLVEEVVRFDLSGSNVKPVFDIASDLWVAEVDKGQIQQVFSNLTINAKQAMADGGHLFITMKNAAVGEGEIAELAAGNYVKVIVRDEGEGIEEKYLGQIFDPYFTTRRLGRGLGLATTYSIIKKHGGCITVESTPAVGTTFSLYLPVSKAELSHAADVGTGEKAGGAAELRVLVVDDEEMICKVTSRFLERAGYLVETVLGGTEAIASYKRALEAGEPFDLVITDLTIPGGMGGKEVVKRLLELNEGARVIVSSGYAEDPVMANYATYGFCGVAAKPYSREKLLSVVRQALAER